MNKSFKAFSQYVVFQLYEKYHCCGGPSLYSRSSCCTWMFFLLTMNQVKHIICRSALQSKLSKEMCEMLVCGKLKGLIWSVFEWIRARTKASLLIEYKQIPSLCSFNCIFIVTKTIWDKCRRVKRCFIEWLLVFLTRGWD